MSFIKASLPNNFTYETKHMTTSITNPLESLTDEQHDRLKLLILHNLGSIQTKIGECIHSAATEFSHSMEFSTDVDRQDYLNELMESIYETQFVKIRFDWTTLPTWRWGLSVVSCIPYLLTRLDTR